MTVDARGRAAGPLAALAVLLLVGMGIYALVRRPTAPASERQPPGPAKYAATGHVYPARLMSEHPLHPMLLRLGRRVDGLRGTTPALGSAEWTPLEPQTLAAALSPPSVPSWDATALETLVCEAMPTAALVPAPAELELAPDLRARMRWLERSIGTQLDRTLEAARYERELALARRRAELVKQYQEALMNADLPPTKRTDADTDASPGRAQLEAAIEAQMQQARVQAEAEFARYSEQTRRSAQQKIAAARRDVATEMRSRQETSVSSGSKTVGRLSKALTSIQGGDYSAEGINWAPDVPGAETGADSSVQGDLDTLYAEAAGRVADGLERRRLQLGKAIYEETVLAVRKCALQEGIVVSIPPLQPAEGQDMTERLRPLIRRSWAADAWLNR